MITLEQYFGDHPHTEEQRASAEELLKRVNALLAAYVESGGKLAKNPRTESYISGVTFGGFRPQDCPQGAKTSSHKEGKAVDIFDPENGLDNWITDLILVKFDLFREHPDFTKFWGHLTTRQPRSGKRTFYP